MPNNSPRLVGSKRKTGRARAPISNHTLGNGRRRRIGSDQAQIAANEYSLLNYAIGYAGAMPRRVSLKNTDVWIVPVVLTSAGYGIVGEVGVILVDAATGKIIGASSRKEVRSAGARLAKEKRAELDAAFHRARKA